jgi:hypothetical protein
MIGLKKVVKAEVVGSDPQLDGLLQVAQSMMIDLYNHGRLGTYDGFQAFVRRLYQYGHNTEPPGPEPVVLRCLAPNANDTSDGRSAAETKEPRSPPQRT